MTGVVIMQQHTQRVSERYEANAACRVCTVLENLEATIIDLSVHGAKINVINAFQADDRISIDIEGDVIWGTVSWAEQDRIGVKFLLPIRTGRFHGILMDAKQRSAFANASRGTEAPARGGFGRRVAA